MTSLLLRRTAATCPTVFARKTTLLSLIAGLTTPTAGRIFIGGRDVTDATAQERNIGLVFQSYALFPHMTVARNVAFGLEQEGLAKAEIERRVREMLEIVQLSDYAQRKPHQLSGGQRQRIAIARAIVLEPEFVVLDEPTSALDMLIQAQIVDLLRDIQKRRELTYLFISHNVSVVRHISDRVAVMYQGKIVESGPAQQVLSHPTHAYTRTLMDAVPSLEKAFSPA